MHSLTLTIEFQCVFKSFKKIFNFSIPLTPDFQERVLKRYTNRRPIRTGVPWNQTRTV